VFRFALLASLGACLINATVGTGALSGLGLLAPGQHGGVWLTWWLGDATGVMTAAPLLLVEGEPALPPRSRGEEALLAGATALLGYLVLWSPYPLFFLLLPLLLWSAFRFGQRGSAAVVALLSLLCVGAALQRAGFFGLYPQERGLLILQAFLGVAALSGLTLGSLVGLRARAELALRQVNEALETHVNARTCELSAANRLLLEQERQLRAYNEALEARLRASVSSRSEQLTESLARLISAGPTSTSPLPGNTFGQVRVGRRVGSGGMADVFEAEDLASGRKVALKVLRDLDRLENLPDLAREARALTAVAHPTIIRTLHVDVAPEGPLYLLLEWVEGETLAARLRRPPAPSAGVAARVGAQLAGGLAAAHAAGVVHCDIKPANVMLTSEPPGLKILDFGISRVERLRLASAADAPSLVGSPPYLSPEQISDPAHVGPPADIYALGVLLFEVLAGGRPFEAATTSGYLLAHLTQPAPDLRPLAPDAPDAVVALIARMLLKNPADRPSADEVARTLTAVADGLQIPPLDVVVAAARAAALADTSVLPSI